MTRFRLNRTLPVATLAGILLAGCNQGAELAATEVLNNTSCKGAEDGLQLVSYADVAKLRGSTLISMSSNESSLEAGAESAADTPLLLFALSGGRQPTAGYYYALKDARQLGDVAELQLHWHTPDPDSMQAQVITYPCIVVGLEQGNFSEVRAVDQHGALLGEIRI